MNTGENFFKNSDEHDPLADFEDEVDEKGQEKRRKSSTDTANLEFEAMLAAAEKDHPVGFKRLRVGDKVEAKVISVGSDSIFLDVQQRSEAVLPIQPLTADDMRDLVPGKVVTLFVSSLANGIELTKSAGRSDGSLDSLKAAQESGLPVDGKVTGENKGGYNVELAGARGFCPFSQMDIVPRLPADNYLNKSFPFRVTQIKGRDVILSRAALMREQQAIDRQKMMANLAVGQTLEGRVTGIENFGFFVDIGGASALVPQSEYSWSRVVSHRDGVNVGDSVRVKIIKIENPLADRPRIAASVKQVEDSPWDSQAATLREGQSMEGIVTRLATFGAFVEILPGVEGLVHISEMSAKKRVHQPGEIVKQGDKVTVQVKTVDTVGRRVSLSMKSLQDEVIEDTAKAKYLREKEAENEHRGVEYTGASSAQAGALADAFKRANSKQK